jgi:hypothetical protein
LHFPEARYAQIRRTGAFTAQSDSFKADSGEKAMKSLDVHGITAKFDLWAVFLWQWRFTDVRMQSGDVEIQIYKAHPEAVPGKPWFAIFLPNRVYLEKIESEQVNITWRFRDERAGFFGTQLLITPNGRDFQPRQDLSERIIELFKESPGAYLSLMFRQFGDWLKKTFGGD